MDLVDEAFVASARLEDYRSVAEEHATKPPIGKDARTPIHYAIRFGSPEQLKVLIALGYDVNKPNKFLNSPLHWAAARWDTQRSGAAIDFVSLLVEAGAKIDSLTIYGETPLMFAETSDVAMYLLERGANVNQRDQNGLNAYEYHLRANRPRVAEFIQNFFKSPSQSLAAEADYPAGLVSDWERQPEVAAEIARIKSLAPQVGVSIPGCRLAAGLKPETAQKLLKNTILNWTNGNRSFTTRTRDLVRETGFYCLGNPKSCDPNADTLHKQRTYYCVSGEAIIVWYGMSERRQTVQPFTVNSIAIDVPPLQMTEPIEKVVHTENLREIPTQISGCKLIHGDDWDSIIWSGECLKGRPVGDGEIQWMKGEQVVWRTDVSPAGGMILKDGKLHYKVNLADFSFSLTECYQGSIGARAVSVQIPQSYSIDFFENGWVAAAVKDKIADYAVDQCPAPRMGLSNIRFKVNIGNSEVLVGRNDNKDRLDWRESSNPARDKLARELNDQEARRIQNIRQQQKELERLEAEKQEQQKQQQQARARNAWLLEMSRIAQDRSIVIENLPDLEQFDQGAFVSMMSEGRQIFFYPDDISMQNGRAIVNSEVITTYGVGISYTRYTVRCLVEPSEVGKFRKGSIVKAWATLVDLRSSMITLECRLN